MRRNDMAKRGQMLLFEQHTATTFTVSATPAQATERSTNMASRFSVAPRKQPSLGPAPDARDPPQT